VTSLFLSYARDDDEPFVKRLYEDLTTHGFEVWWDRASMPNRGPTFTSEIRDAIAAADRFVLVVGPAAAESKYVTQEWQCAIRLDKPVSPALRLGHISTVPEALRLVDIRPFLRDAEYENELKRLVEQLHASPPPLGELHAVPQLPVHLLDRVDAIQKLRDAVAADLERKIVIAGVPAPVGVQGMGGIGKSVLAAMLARDVRVRRLFKDGVIWISVGAQPDIVKLQRGLAGVLGGAGKFTSITEGKARLQRLLAEKAVLLLLDDVWNARNAEAFDCLGPRSRMLVTTRDAQIVTALHGETFQVQLLTDEEALLLLAKWVVKDVAQLPPQAKELIEECGRLALALSLCGAMVRDKHSWDDLLEALRHAELEFIEHDLKDYAFRDIWKAIKVSVDALKPDERDRFLELAVFPVDESIPQAALVTFWTYTGKFAERHARKVMTKLASRALIQWTGANQASPADTADTSARRAISVHDLTHDFATRVAQSQSGGLRSLHAKLLDAYGEKCPTGWQDGPNDGYFLTHLRKHLAEAGRESELADLLTDLRWLEAKSAAALVFDLDNDFSMAQQLLPTHDPRRRLLRLLDEALRRDIHFIDRHREDYPQGLFQCLWNRCWWFDCPELRQHFKAIDRPASPFQDSLRPVHRLLEEWRQTRGARTPDFMWARAMRPPLDALGGAQLAVLGMHEDPIVDLSIAPSGYLASVSRNACCIWDESDGSEVARCESPALEIRCASLSPDGNLLVLGYGQPWMDNGELKLFEARTCDPITELGVFESAVTSVCFSQDSRYLAAGASDGTIRIYEIATATMLSCFKTGDEEIVCVRFFSDGRRLAYASGRQEHPDSESGLEDWSPRVDVCDWATGELIWTFAPQGDAPIEVFSCLVVSDTGALLASGTDEGNVYVCDAATGSLVHAIPASGTYEIGSLLFWDDDELIAIGRGSSLDSPPAIEIREVVTGDLRQTFVGHTNHIIGLVANSRDNTLISASWDTSIRLWDTTRKDDHTTPVAHTTDVEEIAFRSDGREAASISTDGMICIWDTETGFVRTTTKGALYDRHIHYSPDGNFLAASGSSLHLIMRQDGQMTADKLPGSSVSSVAFSPNNSVIAYGMHSGFLNGSCPVVVWDIEKHRIVFEMQQPFDVQPLEAYGGAAYIAEIEFHPDGRWFAASCQSPARSRDLGVHVWDATIGESVALLCRHKRGLRAIAFSPDGRYLATSSFDETVRIWRTRSWKAVRRLASTGKVVDRLMFSDDSRWLIAASSQTRLVWETSRWKLVESYHDWEDVDALARRAHASPWLPCRTGFDTLIRHWTDRCTVAAFPGEVQATSPSGQTWASVAGNHVQFFALDCG
jgi:WD40 repeat protein